MPSAIPACGALQPSAAKKEPLTGFKRNETVPSQVGLRGFVFHVTYTECHSVRSWALPALSFQVSLVASEKRHTVSLRQACVGGMDEGGGTNRDRCALLEVRSDALAEAIGAPLARGIERGLGTWEGCGFVLPSSREGELIRYRQSPRPPRSSSIALTARTMRMPRLWKY